MNWHKATDQELTVIIAFDEMSLASDIIEAKDELDRREVQR